MNAKIFIVITVLFLAGKIHSARCQETADSLSRQLQEVVVTANQPATRLVGSTIVSTIAGSGLADLGTALDVLAQLPMIRVTDNTVSVIGKNDVEIFIDGRPMRDSGELQTLLSSNLKKVELLMAPGAAYESTTDAVLKITTRRNIAQGLSLTDRFELQRRRKWSVTEFLGVSYRTGGWEMFAEGSVNRSNSIIKGTTTNTLVYDGRKTVVGSRQYNSYPATAGVVKAGFNYVKGAQMFGAYYRCNPERGDFTNNGAEWIDEEDPLRRDITRKTRAHSHLASVYYENSFAGRYLLHFDGDFRRSDATNGVSTVYPESIHSDVSSDDRHGSTLWAGKLTLEFPLWKGNFSVGSQDSYTHTSLDYRMLNDRVGQYIPSVLTDSRQTSAALFATWERRFGRFSLSAGVRYEYVDYDFRTDGKRDGDVSRRDHTLTPDISLGYDFSDDAQITASYRMATVKPPYSQLTGSLSYVGLHEIEGGNPALRDERMHDLRVSGMWKGFMLRADFTRSHDTYAFVKQLYPANDLQLLMHPVNINVSAASVYLVWGKPIGCWTPNITAGLYRQWLAIGDTRYNKPLFSYYFDNTFALPCGWTITANIIGQTRGDIHTNRFDATPFTMDASVGKTFFGKSLTVKISADDIFNTVNYGWTMRTYGVTVDKRQSHDRRGLTLSLIYTLHPRRSAYRGTSASPAELRRL